MISLTRALARNWTLKVSAFGLALLLWVAVRVEVPTVQDISGIPVRVDLADPRWAVLEDPIPATVTIRFAGSSRDLIRIAMERPAITIPLDGVNSADTVVVLNASWISNQGRQGVEIEDIQPSNVRVVLEPIERRSFAPSLRFEGSLADTLALATAPVVEPAEIRVSGPRSRIGLIDSVPVLPIDLSAVTASGPVFAMVDTTTFSGLLVQPSEVQVHLVLEEKITWSLNDIPVVLPGTLQGSPDLLPRFTSATAVLQGARSAVDQVDISQLAFTVDTSGLSLPLPGEEMEFPLRLEGLPPFLTGEPRPETVTVRNVSEAQP